MSRTVLLYGATGFSGRLIAAEGGSTGMANLEGTPEPRMILAGRDGAALENLARRLGMDYRVFGLRDKADVRRGLRDIDVVINAAGPFARTALPLLDAAINVGCHYVDINGELDVYMALAGHANDPRIAARIRQRRLAVVASAGHTAAASDLMLHAALDELRARPLDGDRELGAVRVVLSCTFTLSRGSAKAVWRSVREHVTVVRASRLCHEPVGKLERTFDFRAQRHGDEPAERDLRVGSAANLVDTVTAMQTVKSKTFSVKNIESYVEAGTAARFAYQLGAWVAPFTALPPARLFAEQQISLLAAGPTLEELRQKEIVLLYIDDTLRTRLVDWRWETPNAYQFTAQVVIEIARRTAAAGFSGWLTPGAIFGPTAPDLTADVGPLRGCLLTDRLARTAPVA